MKNKRFQLHFKKKEFLLVIE